MKTKFGLKLQSGIFVFLQSITFMLLSAEVFAFTDVANLVQNRITAMQTQIMASKQIQQIKQQAEQLLKVSEQVKYQIEQLNLQKNQFNNQISQYDLMKKNSKNLAAGNFQWSDASNTIDQLLNSINNISEINENSAQIDQHLANYKDIDQYLNNPDIKNNDYSQEKLSRLKANQTEGSKKQKFYNSALYKTLNFEQKQIKENAKRLKNIQNGAQNAEGQMAALQYANQIASHQSNQLLQMRGLAVAQHQASLVREQVLADKIAQEAAITEHFKSGKFKKSPLRKW